MNNYYLEKFGKRIRNKLNSIKRPVNIAAKELNIEEKILNDCINGKLDEKDVINIVHKIVNKYPIKISNIFLEKNTTKDGVIYCSNEYTMKSKRVICRNDKNGNQTPYYNYYDCAMNKYSPFKPELIDMVRLVYDNDPENKDVIYNKGHLETQLTFYIDKVNTYYEINNKKYCIETNTGDCNLYIPYVPHTFANRDEKFNSRILAITFSSNIVDNISNLSYISYEGLNSISGDLRNTEELFEKRLKKYLDRNFLSKDDLINELLKKHDEKEVDNYFNKNIKLDKITKDICNLLNIKKNEIIFEKLEEETIFKKFDNIYHKRNNLLLNKHTISKNIRDVVSYNVKLKNNDDYNIFNSCYYQFIYNYSKNPFLFKWGKNMENKKIINSGDSLNIFPFINHSFSFMEKESDFYLVKVPGGLNETILNEYSLFDPKNKYRFCDNESKKWW